MAKKAWIGNQDDGDFPAFNCICSTGFTDSGDNFGCPKGVFQSAHSKGCKQVYIIPAAEYEALQKSVRFFDNESRIVSEKRLWAEAIIDRHCNEERLTDDDTAALRKAANYIISLVSEIEAQREVMREARKFMRHNRKCTIKPDNAIMRSLCAKGEEFEPRPCSCGFEQALAKLDEILKGVDDGK